MWTVRQKIENEIKSTAEWLDNQHEMLRELETNYPKVLELEAPYIAIYAPHEVHLSDAGDPENTKGLATTLLRISGLKRVLKHLAWNQHTREATFPLEGTGIRVLLRNQDPRGCKKYRVLVEKVVTVCGEIDRTLYESVTRID